MPYRFDHRRLGDEMEIFFFDDEIGAGLPVWLPNGMAIRDQLERFIKELERKQGYQRVSSPHLGRGELYERSGHLGCFRESMFPPIRWEGDGRELSYFLKPMNCPHHHKIFRALPRSYRQLPLRLAEYGQVYRCEPSGSLRGLSRARGLCQNDAHIYVEPESSFEEVLRVLDLHELCYRKLGQVLLIPLSSRELPFCERLRRELVEAGLRPKLDESQGSLSKRVRFAHRYRPFSKIVVGPAEAGPCGALKLQMRSGIVPVAGAGELVRVLGEACRDPS